MSFSTATPFSVQAFGIDSAEASSENCHPQVVRMYLVSPLLLPLLLSMEDHLEWLTERLSTLGRGQTISTESWFAEQPSSAAQQGLLLALLEMARRGTVLLHQADHLGPIVIEVAKRVPVAARCSRPAAEPIAS